MENTSRDELREVQREYYRKWRAKNPEKYRAIQDRFWRKKLDQARRERDQASEQAGNDN